MIKARIRRLEKRLLPTIKEAGGLMIQLHHDGSGTDTQTGRTYTAEEISQKERTGGGWLVAFPADVPTKPERKP